MIIGRASRSSLSKRWICRNRTAKVVPWFPVIPVEKGPLRAGGDRRDTGIEKLTTSAHLRVASTTMSRSWSPSPADAARGSRESASFVTCASSTLSPEGAQRAPVPFAAEVEAEIARLFHVEHWRVGTIAERLIGSATRGHAGLSFGGGSAHTLGTPRAFGRCG